MRPIDADALFDFLTDQLDKVPGFYSMGRNAGICVARATLHDETITPTISPPPNDPLTLEQLREMDGEPVWVTSVNNGRGRSWTLVDTKYEICREVHGGLAVFENYGKTWLAYRRKPEEGMV